MNATLTYSLLLIIPLLGVLLSSNNVKVASYWLLLLQVLVMVRILLLGDAIEVVVDVIDCHVAQVVVQVLVILVKISRLIEVYLLLPSKVHLSFALA